MTFEVTFDDADMAIVEDYMKQTKMDISEIARQAILEMIFNDDADLAAYEKAIAEYKKNPVTCTHEELLKKLGMA
ncbi:MAG: CopG family transcriptional regulator [Selenomonadaceae bacterium]|nr:CopG family transcriptional regulator [Selenomonadaceae bacterium]